MVRVINSTFLAFLFLFGLLSTETTGQGLGPKPIENRDSLMDLLPGSSGQNRVNILNEISYSLFHSDSDSSLFFADKALTLSDSLEYREGRVISLMLTGSIYRVRKNFDEAFVWLKNAESLMDSTTHWFTEMRVRYTIGNTYRDLGQVDSALIRYRAIVDRFSQDQNWWPVVSAYNSMAIMYFSVKDYDNQLLCLEELRNIILERYKYPDTNILSYNAVNRALEPARFYSLHGRYPEALKAIDEVMKSFKDIKIPAVEESYFMAKTTGQKARVFSQWGKYRSSLAWHDTSIRMFKESMEIFADEIRTRKKRCSGADFDMNLANQLEGKAIVQIHLGDFAGASDNFYTSAKKRQAVNDPLGVAMCYDGLGEIKLLQGRYSEAVTFYDSAMFLKLDHRRRITENFHPVAAKKNYPTIDESIAITCMKMGDLYRDWDKPEIALENYIKAREYSTGIGSIKGEAEALNAMGKIFLEQGLNDKALEHFNRSLSLFRKMDIRPGAAEVLKNIGDYYKAGRRYSDAIIYYDSSETIAGEILLSSLQAELFFEKAGIYDLQGNLPSSVDLYEKSLKVSQEAVLVKLWMQAHNKLAGLYEKMKRYDKAFDHLQEFNSLKDSLFTLDATKQIAHVEAEYETGIREQQIQLMEKENELRMADLRQSRFWIFALAMVLLFMLTLVFLYIRQNRLKTIQGRLILEQRLLRTQMNPHFIFNALANIQSFMFANDAQKAGRYLSKLSHLLRNVLEGSKDEFVLFSKELETIESYLELQKLRLAGNLDYSNEVDENIDTEMTEVPPMLAQPFIEDAIERRIRHKKEKGEVRIKFSLSNHSIECTIEDNGVGKVKSAAGQKDLKKQHHSMATLITVERLKTLSSKFRQSFTLRIVDLPDKSGESAGRRVEFNFPFLT